MDATALIALLQRQENNPITLQSFTESENQRDTTTDFWRVVLEKDTRIHSTTLHLEIKNNLIWIHRDETEDGIAADLEQHGVPKEQIMLAFHPPYKRPYTGFATGE